MEALKVPTIEDVRAAATNLKGQAIHTPLLKSQALDAVTGCNVYVKPECMQRTGSFKFRGAYNAISRLTPGEREKGVAASSSGNHAQGIAEAAALFGVSTTIVMPSDAPKMKVERTKASGAEVILYDRSTEDRESIVQDYVAKTGRVFIHPYDNYDVVAGQGTVGIEISQDLAAMSETPDRVLICTGGGGLTAGTALSVHDAFPQAKIHSVEPEGFDDYRRSLLAQKPVGNKKSSGSICDAILSPSPGEISFAINRELLDEGLVISDDEALQAVAFAFRELKLVLEPGGAASLAALLKHGKDWKGQTVVVVASGGNVDPSVFARAIA